MIHHPDHCRHQAFDLIAEAVPEPCDIRRQALLVMADQWLALAERRASRTSAPGLKARLFRGRGRRAAGA